jgi:dethiobiotin synthetase
MKTNYFITATDTDAGKTYVARALTIAFVQSGYQVAVYKPIAAGCELVDDQLVNEDAFLLQQASNCQQTIQQINPIALEQAIAPHIAAYLLGKNIDVERIKQGFKQLPGDINITEGAGGWRLPLGNGQYLSDIVQWMNSKVILVVNMKLGCLNHAILTYQSILNDGLDCVAWVANCQTDMPYLQENITELTTLLPIPCIAQFTYQADINIAAGQVNINALR